ncbi:MAG: SDR family oxidoreductase [Candidatus Scalindua sp. AMX11]|nr:MAG: SDR family NAD(P)-dependent oxidoreductase [Candidatus Scalindua sp.]NOG84797.1 SDR family oxidoreductase [Planctomycetota bacterium]RZV98397.1 MAG: SDR family oxidoreductase [Candidatus Scalindua sp. SCAELEC01]TDE66506.1 MAG: SDR family oxidoreductase [Candidatus Scalindua sp. AMX11]GJQ58870.1 MAG: 3-oxoacyl-ACP reductase [Candidatus Scalindua sp.]
MKLAGRVAIVTGGSSDKGGAIAELLASEGACVVINYLKNREKAESILKKIVKNGKAIICQADVMNKESVDSMVEAACKEFGGVDILVNNVQGRIRRKPFEETVWDEYVENLHGAVKGAYNCCHSVLEEMKSKKWGRVINVIDNIVNDPVSGYSNYITAQSALVGFTRSLAVDLGLYGITVNLINAGFTITGKTPHAPLRVQEEIARQTPLRRLALPIDIAKALLFYASDWSDFVTGNCLIVDGGKAMR